MEQFYRNEHIIPKDLSKAFIPVDSKNWRKPKILSIQDLVNNININVSESRNSNITAIKYTNQHSKPKLPPDTNRVDTKAHIAIDDNYIYVWVPALKRWKRSILSEW